MSEKLVGHDAAIEWDRDDCAERNLTDADISLANPALHDPVVVVIFISDAHARGEKVRPILRRSFNRLPLTHTATERE